MCEFTVYVEDNGIREKITKNVVKAKLKDGTITLMDSAGSLTRLDHASIQIVDTLTQELVLKKEA